MAISPFFAWNLFPAERGCQGAEAYLGKNELRESNPLGLISDPPARPGVTVAITLSWHRYSQERNPGYSEIGAEMQGDRLVTVGRSLRRQDAVEKVTGAAKYTGDIEFPGLLEGAVLRSVFPHALIESIDARKAEALTGVVAVLTRDDLTDIDPYYGHCLRDRPLIAIDRVRYIGEPV
ncbi:MAG TPA: hypothetical protein VNO43_09185, partial [Candidatus Eisenbacteria bacterium]|nr:hypothetical protein [Candidatus Eisenbacteria bacterium]